MTQQVYPETDVGLGTAYERLAIYQLFDQYLDGRDVKTALEGPIDGMAGLGGVHLVGRAQQGTHVTVELPDAPALERVRGVYQHLGIEDRLTTAQVAADAEFKGEFDLVLTYNALPLLADWKPYLARVARHAKKYLLVSVTSPFSYGVMMRKAMRKVEGGAADELFDHPSCRPEFLEPELKQYGRIVGHEFLDSPWWPDLFVETGQSLFSGTLRRLPGLRHLVSTAPGPAKQAGYLYGPDDFPLLPGHPGHAAFLELLSKHPVFDSRGTTLARLFGHHHAYLVEVQRG